MPLAAVKPKDPNTNIPPAVRRASERADELARQASGAAPEPPTAPDQPASASEPPQPPAEPPVAEAAPQPPEPAPEPPQPPAEPSENDESWKTKYDRQVGRTRQLQKDVSNLTTRIDELQRLLATLPTEAPAASNAPQFETYLTPEMRQEWSEALPVMEALFSEKFAPVEHELKTKITHLESQLQNQGKQSARVSRQELFHKLDTHPVLGAGSETYWQAVNQDEDFIGWLQYPDPLSGRKRHEMLQEAFDLNDATRFANFFESFLKEAGRYAAPQPAPAPAPGSPPAGNGLERYAAPGPARAAPAPGPAADSEIFTTGDISRFYADKRTGRWKGREAEADAYEAKIFAAQRAGRVRPGAPQP